MKHVLASSRWLHRAPRWSNCVDIRIPPFCIPNGSWPNGIWTGPWGRIWWDSGGLFEARPWVWNSSDRFSFCIVSFPGSSHFLYSDYIIPQFLKNVKRVLNIFYGSFEIPDITSCTIYSMSLRPYIRKFVNSSTDTSDYLFWSISPFLFIPYYNRFLLFIYLFIKKNEKQRKNKEERISGNVKLK